MAIFVFGVVTVVEFVVWLVVLGFVWRCDCHCLDRLWWICLLVCGLWLFFLLLFVLICDCVWLFDGLFYLACDLICDCAVCGVALYVGDCVLG